MPEIGNYGQLNASTPLDPRINSVDKNASNKQSNVKSPRDPEIQRDEGVIRQDFDRAQKKSGSGFSSNRELGQIQIPIAKENIESEIALRENGFSGLANFGEPTISDKRKSFVSLEEPNGIETFQRTIEEIGPKPFQLADKTVENNMAAERIDQSIDTLNKRMEELGRSVRFSKDREFDREVITVVNPDSGDIVRQIPTEYAIRVSEGLKSLRGLLFDDKA
ncbi:flagellar protein FlaG [Betaproteobacteria bacterium]|nr:flagellar protein FlaG [Betaproteobacteria bacterium]